MSEEMVCAGTHCSNCVHESDLPLVLQGRVGAHKLGVVGNTIYVLLRISSGIVTVKNYENWFTNKKVIAKI